MKYNHDNNSEQGKWDHITANTWPCDKLSFLFILSAVLLYHNNTRAGPGVEDGRNEDQQINCIAYTPKHQPDQDAPLRMTG